MFVGRLGPLTLVVALAARERRRSYRWAEEAVKIG
jgi:Trk-type K+ transport system membrane component